MVATAGAFLTIVVASFFILPVLVVLTRVVRWVRGMVHHDEVPHKDVVSAAKGHGPEARQQSWVKMRQRAITQEVKMPLRLRVHAYLYSTTSWGLRLDLFQGLLSALSCGLFVYSTYVPLEHLCQCPTWLMEKCAPTTRVPGVF